MKLVSPCCGAEVCVAHEAGWFDDKAAWTTKWFECCVCGRPCDPVEAEEKRK